MKVTFQNVRPYFLKCYQTIYGDEFEFVKGWSESPTTPTWVDVSSKRLTTADEVVADGGVIVDPEIGLLQYLLPLDSLDDIPTSVVRAASMRSQLSPNLDVRAEGNDQGDASGPWRIAICWFTDSLQRRKELVDVLAKLRQKSTHFEEIPVDIVSVAGSDWVSALQKNGMPRLLLETRRVFRRHGVEEVERWLSADAALADALRGFERSFTNPSQVAVAREFVERFSGIGVQPAAVTKPANPTKGKRMKTFSVSNFRNLSSISIAFEDKQVSATVITGPNGTGKSALFEAMSLAHGGTSQRYLNFLEDKDISIKDKGADYLKHYLPNQLAGGKAPVIVIDGEQRPVVLPPDRESALVLDRALDGSFLSQERSAFFAVQDSSSLAATVLGEYSKRSAELVTFAEDEYDRANGARQTLLRSLGASAAITKTDTAYRRAVERILNDAVPFSTAVLVQWLSKCANDFSEIASDANEVLQDWKRLEKQRDAVVSAIVTLPERALIEGQLLIWMAEFNRCAARTKSWLDTFGSAGLESARGRAVSLAQGVASWGGWLEDGKAKSDQQVNPEVVGLRTKLSELESQHREIISREKELSDHAKHLESASQFISKGWQNRHSSTCPTCESDISARGGIVAVVQILLPEIARRHAAIGEELKNVISNLKSAGDGLARMGIRSNPVTVELQLQIRELLTPILTKIGVKNLEDWIGNADRRRGLEGFLGHVASLPVLPPTIDAENAARDGATKLDEKIDEINRVFARPDDVKAVLDVLKKVYAEVVQVHLPRTTQALWRELALSMTSAPWLSDSPPAIKVQNIRGDQRASIRIDGFDGEPLARHILNQAEVHVLGLAWFFVRYLTSGRFSSNYLVMDDPAQEMDQTTYRDFCRLLEALLRIHRISDRELCLILLLHQEDRALDAARLLGAMLHVLGWTVGQSNKSMNTVRVLGDSNFTPSPKSVVLN
ncbi:MAG TPA: ATP-binding protein [Burkholderiales bacterium]|nr:ATP-binding protein [Burkholderiales bacterium]